MTIHGEPSLLNNPLVRGFLTGWARHIVSAIGALIVQHAIASPEAVDSFTEPAIQIVVGVCIFLLGLALSNLQTFWNRQKLVTAQAMPAGATEKQVEQVIKRGDAPPVTLGKTEEPSKIGAEPYEGTGTR